MFHIGQDVICINDDWSNPPWEDPWQDLGLTVPIKNCIYKIRGFPRPEFADTDVLWLVLEEIVNRPVMGVEPCFSSICFRPVERRSSSAGIIRKLLVPTRQKEDA